MPVPPQEAPDGTGHGDPEVNAEVEAAAMALVTTAYEAEGYRVTDVSAENLGWDLAAVRKSEEVRIEVKGTSGEAVRFWLTANERRHAEADDNWVLATVTSALTTPQLWVMDGQTVVDHAAPYVYRVEVPADEFE